MRTLLLLVMGFLPNASAQDFAPVEARTADGRFVARIERAPGQETVPASLARFRLAISERSADAGESVRWSVLYPHDGAPARYLLAPGGRAFVELEERFHEGRAVLGVQTAGGRTQWTGAELSVTRELTGGDERREWLDPKREPALDWVDGAFGPCLELRIPLRDGTDRRVDVVNGRVVSEPVVPRIEPAVQGALPVRCAVPYVNGVEYPRVVRAGRPFALEFDLNHATPNWTFLGFELECGDGVLHLTPRSQAPDGVQAQVLSAFRASATIRDLPVGRYALRVEGWNPGGPSPVSPEIEVVPEDLLVGLRTTGGFAGVAQRYDVHESGLLRRQYRRDAPAEFLELGEAQVAKLRELLGALPATSRRAKTPRAADLFAHVLGFFSGAAWVAIEVDDLAATEPERTLIDWLRAL
jgi:hypothetical protein